MDDTTKLNKRNAQFRTHQTVRHWNRHIRTVPESQWNWIRNSKTPHKTINEMNNGLSPTWPMDSFSHCVINRPIHFDFFLISAFRVQFFNVKTPITFLFSLPVLCRFYPTITQQPQKSTLISLMVTPPIRLINQIHFLLYYGWLHNIYISKWGGIKSGNSWT